MPYFPPIQQDQYPATSDTQCLQIIIPDGDEFKALLAGLIVSAAAVNNYADPESAQSDGLAAIWDEAISQINWEGCIVRTMVQVDLFAFNASIIGSGSLTYSGNAALPFSLATFTPNTSGSGFKNTVWLAAGSYLYSGWGTFSTNGGNSIIGVYDQSLNLVDNIISAFSQSGTFGNRDIKAGAFDIPADGLYEIVVANNGTGTGAQRQANWISHHIRQTA